MKILVTGAGGQLGLSFRKVAGEYPLCEFLFADADQCDITDRESVARFVAGVDVIINCAAYTAVDRAEEEQESAYTVNAGGVAVLAAAAAEYGAKLVHISTDYVFDGNYDRPITENDAPNPMNVYGQSKLSGELEIIRLGIDAVIVRTSWLYSEFGSNFVKTMLRLADTKDEVRVVSDQTGSPTYATGLVRAIMVLIEKGIRGTEIYNYCDAGSVSWYDFAEEIFRLSGKPVTLIPLATEQYPAAAHRPKYSVLDTSKIRSEGVVVCDWKHSLSECIEALNVSKRLTAE